MGKREGKEREEKLRVERIILLLCIYLLDWEGRGGWSWEYHLLVGCMAGGGGDQFDLKVERCD